MKNIITLIAVAAISMIGCGDNKTRPDSGGRPDTPGGIPNPPALGAQIDRMGRPAINTALNHGFDGTAAAGSAKDDYNANSTRTSWLAYVPEFMKNLAIIDALDTGVCGNGICELGENGTDTGCTADCTMGSAQIGSGNGCGNQVLYNGGLGGSAMATSYQQLAGIMAGDELYLDTGKMNCPLYLAVEFAAAIGGTNSTCGGRAPSYDVIDFTYSLATMGLAGFNLATFEPRVKDGAGPHADITADFPFLGPPHP